MNISTSISRRELLARMGGGFTGLAMASVMSEAATAPPSHPGPYDQQAKEPHFRPRARAVIQLFMHGGPSHVDLLDPKPMLDRYHGQRPPAEAAADQRIRENLLRSPFRFSKHGQSGLEFSEILPNIARHADRIAVIRSMYTENSEHEHAIWMMQTGMVQTGRPNIGSWIAYGLGTVNQNLPAYVVLPDPRGRPQDGIRNWSSGWLPPVYQGTPFRSEGMPVLNLQPRMPRPTAIEENRFRLLRDLNASHRNLFPEELDLDARIANFEMAARMQLSATDALDLSQETLATQRLYGMDDAVTRSYGTRCLMARRLVERGVRFVQIFMHGSPWDGHGNNAADMRSCCQQTDLPIAGLLADLHQRGLLESTLIFWAGEFGRTPSAQGRDGRDHHRFGFSVWLAGGGIKGGRAYGATDDFGFHAVSQRTSVAQLHATILHLLGLDHRRLTYHRHGRDERLTDVHSPPVLTALL